MVLIIERYNCLILVSTIPEKELSQEPQCGIGKRNLNLEFKKMNFKGDSCLLPTSAELLSSLRLVLHLSSGSGIAYLSEWEM